MKWLMLAILAGAPPAWAQDGDALVTELQKYTRQFLDYKYQDKAQREEAEVTVENDVDGLRGKFKALKKSSEGRASVFGALVTLEIAASPFDNDGAGATNIERVIAQSPALETEYKSALDDYTRQHQGQLALSCRASNLKQKVEAHACLRKDPKSNTCFAKLKNFAECADLPDAG